MNYRKISFITVFLLGINSIIGSGIFILPANAYASFGYYSLWTTFFTLGLTFLFGLCFAEMSGIYPQSGGVYIYAKKTFGDFIGFNVGFFNFFSATMTWSTGAAGFTQILSAFFPIFHEGSVYALILPPILIFITAGIALLGIGNTTLSSNIVTIAKLIPLILFCVIGIFYIHKENLVTRDYIPTHNTLSAFSTTVLIFFYAFTGFEMIPLAASTMKNPTKNLPRVFISVLLFIGLFYALILFVCIGILGPELATSNNPIADAFAKVLGPIGFDIIWIGSLISVFGLLVATGFEGPHALSSLAKDDFLSKKYAITASAVPVRSIIFMACLAATISATGNFEILLKALSFILLILYIVPACAIFVSRNRHLKSTFRVPLYPFTPTLTIIITIYLLLNTSFSEIIYGLMALLFSILIYFLYAKPNRKKVKI